MASTARTRRRYLAWRRYLAKPSCHAWIEHSPGYYRTAARYRHSLESRSWDTWLTRTNAQLSADLAAVIDVEANLTAFKRRAQDRSGDAPQ